MPTRKPMRLKDYDYSEKGAYFITICVRNRRPVLSTIKASNETGNADVQLTDIGIVADRAIREIPMYYHGVSVDKYVVMPNHIHMLIQTADRNEENQETPSSADISRIVRQLKGFVTKQIGKAIWQSSYYDHIIRNQDDYNDVWNYIDTNPIRWAEDELYESNEH